jgi:peptidoglycan L-alanyl-D-glutamate endopeptidase CwlK
MITSRSLEDLLPQVRVRAEAFLAKAKLGGIDLLVTCTYRDEAAQEALYAQGRTKKGLIVTNARGGQSYHNYRCALDVWPLRNGKIVWSTTGHDASLWETIGQMGEDSGLDWAGRWKGRLREMAHFQYTGGLTWQQLASGAKIPVPYA